MNIILIILIFCIVLFLYIHIFFHLKTSDDLEIFEINQTSKERLEEICDLRQPINFEINMDNFEELKESNILKNFGSFDIKLRNIEEISTDTEGFLPILLEKGIKVLGDCKNKKYISENNSDFLEETSLLKIFKANDEFIRPLMMSSYFYDYLIGSKEAITPFRYDLNYRNYYMVLNGKVKVKLTPPKNSKYLFPIKDYDNFEFRSPINPWDVNEKYKNNFNKIKCLEITLVPGNILFIPAYWWYSFQFEEEKTSILSFKYRTYMNTLAISPELFLSFLQKQNIKHNYLNKMAVSQ